MAVRWARFAPLTGLGLVACFVVEAVSTGAEPGSKATSATVIAFYSSHRGRSEVGAYFLLLAVVVGLFFFGLLYEHLRVAERSPRLAVTAFGGAIVFVVSGVLGAGETLALAEIPSRLGPQAAQALNLIQNYLLAYVVNGGAAAVLLAAGAAILRGRHLPSWSGWLAVVLGVCSLVPVPNGGALTAGLWTLVISITMFVRPGGADPIEAAAVGAGTTVS